MYSSFVFSFYPSYVLCFLIVSHSLIPFKHIRHRLIVYMSVALCFLKGPFTWVSDIFKGVLIMPPAKGYY